jgi:hypothetical protein
MAKGSGARIQRLVATANKRVRFGYALAPLTTFTA